MKLIITAIFLLILINYIVNYLKYKNKKDTYLKAGEKWDGIVEELRRRK